MCNVPNGQRPSGLEIYLPKNFCRRVLVALLRHPVKRTIGLCPTDSDFGGPQPYVER